MYRIVQKNALNASVIQMDIQAPLVARKARPGQFVILRVDGQGERIPLTIAGCDEQTGTVRIIFQMVGATTLLLGQKAAGESIPDFVGPLGTATELAGLQPRMRGWRRRGLCHRPAYRAGAACPGRERYKHHRLSWRGAGNIAKGLRCLLGQADIDHRRREPGQTR